MKTYKEFKEEFKLDEEKIPVQHVTDSVTKVLGTKGSSKFLTHLRPGTKKHTTWDNVNNALMDQGIKPQHIASIAVHVKPSQFKEEVELQEADQSVEINKVISAIKKHANTKAVIDVLPDLKVTSNKTSLYNLLDVLGKHGVKSSVIDSIHDTLSSCHDCHEEYEEFNEGVIAHHIIRKAVAIAKKKGGNMTGAVDDIEKLHKGLSDHPRVAKELRIANEDYSDLDDNELLEVLGTHKAIQSYMQKSAEKRANLVKNDSITNPNHAETRRKLDKSNKGFDAAMVKQYKLINKDK